MIRVVLALFTCSAFGAMAVETAPPVDREVFTRPLASLDDSGRKAFFRGRNLFRQSWVVAPAEASSLSGLGPLYNRLACVSCHPKNGRGRAPEGPAERMQAMLARLSVPGRGPHGGPKPHPAYGDQLNEEGVPGVVGEGLARIHWEAEETVLPDGERVFLRRPRIELAELAYGSLDGALISARVAPAVFGLGLLEAIPVETLERLAAEKKPDGVRGRLNRVWDVAQARQVIGRFGLKANMSSLRQQNAGAFLGDLGITSPLFPLENCTSVQQACRRAPSGGKPGEATELSDAQLADITCYVAQLAPPPRRDLDDPQVRRGEGLFAAAGCAVCHRRDLPRGAVAAYTDLLLHDMGKDLADGRPDYRAGGREWRTPPLWGIGLTALVSEVTHFLHDGRARNLHEAILWHGGEARRARKRYAAMPAADRAALRAFLDSL